MYLMLINILHVLVVCMYPLGVYSTAHYRQVPTYLPAYEISKVESTEVCFGDLLVGRSLASHLTLRSMLVGV